MLTPSIVNEIRTAAAQLPEAELWDYVGAVKKALGKDVKYATIWSALYGRSGKGAKVAPLPDPFPDVEDWGAWFERVIELRGGEEVSRYALAKIRALRRP